MISIDELKTEKKQKLSEWFSQKEILSISWIENESREKRRNIKQGDIYICELGENIGHEQCKTRPVLVVSDTRFNKNGLINIIPLTSTVHVQENAKGTVSPKIKLHYILKKENYVRLSNDSAVNPMQMKSVSTIRLKQYIGHVNDNDWAGIKARLKTLFGF